MFGLLFLIMLYVCVGAAVLSSSIEKDYVHHAIMKSICWPLIAIFYISKFIVRLFTHGLKDLVHEYVNKWKNQ